MFAMAAPTAWADQCATKEKAQQSIASFKETMKSIKDKQDARKVELEGEIKVLMKKMVDSKRWTQAQSDSFFKDQRDTPEVQEESKILNKRASGAMSTMMKAGTLLEEHHKKGDFIQACRQIKPYIDGATAFTEVNERDLLFRLNLVKKAYAR